MMGPMGLFWQPSCPCGWHYYLYYVCLFGRI